MYPEPITPRPSQMNAREFIDLVEKLITLNINEHREVQHPIPDRKYVAALVEEIEVVKRQLTDYLLAADGRRGLYAKGEHE